MNDLIAEGIEQRKIITAILAETGEEELPTIGEFVASELVNGALDYSGIERAEVTAIKYHLSAIRNEYELAIYHEALKLEHSKIEPRITKQVIGAVTPFNERLEIDLYLEMIIFEGIMKSRSELPRKLTREVKTIIMPSLTEQEQHDITGIAQSMKPYLTQDLKFIKKNFLW